jgi:hypothetical protein
MEPVVVTFSELREKFPKGWGDLTLGQFQGIYREWEVDKPAHERDYFKLLTILGGYKETNPTPEKEEAIYQLTRWVNEEPINYSTDVRAFVDVDGYKVRIEKVEELSIGQNILVKQELDKAKYMEECLSMVLAIYLQPRLDGKKFDFERAKEWELRLRECKASELYGLGFFLLTRALKRGKSSPMRWFQIRNSLLNMLKRTFHLWPSRPLSQGMGR